MNDNSAHSLKYNGNGSKKCTWDKYVQQEERENNTFSMYM